jgi:glycosyltransferase involved in cell wall biosynthesis
MRVVYVSTLWGGGPISHLRYLLPHVARAGVEVKVLCSLDHVAEVLLAEGIDAEVAALQSKYDARGAWRVRHTLRSADVVHTHDRRAGLLARPVARAAGARVVHTYHGLPEPIAVRVGRSRAPRVPDVSRLRAAWLLYGYLGVEAALARLGVIVVPSHGMARFLGAHGLPLARMRVIPSGVDVRRWEPTPANEPFVVGTAAILHHLKGIDVLVESCARVDRPVLLRIIGEGPTRADLEHQARRLGVRVDFLGAVEDARDHIARFDAFVLPSRGENLPISILEAMAAAVPVVATNVGGVPELLDEGRAGILVEPDSPDALAEAITMLIVDPERRRELGRAGALRAGREFDAHTVSRRLVDLYRELIAQAGVTKRTRSLR